MQCIDEVCLEAGHWILAVAGVAAIGGGGLIALQRAIERLASALQGLASALGNFMAGMGFLVLAILAAIALYCAITGTSLHVNLY